MSEPAATDQSVLMWAANIAIGILYALFGFTYYQIRQSKSEAVLIAEGVRSELLRAAAASERAVDVLREETNRRWEQAQRDRDTIRTDNRKNHEENAARVDRLIERMADLATRGEVMPFVTGRRGAGE